VQGLRSFGLLYYNAAIALPLCVLIAAVTGEVSDLMVFPDLLNPVGVLEGASATSSLRLLLRAVE
jgi:hypothetical protein